MRTMSENNSSSRNSGMVHLAYRSPSSSQNEDSEGREDFAEENVILAAERCRLDLDEDAELLSDASAGASAAGAAVDGSGTTTSEGRTTRDSVESSYEEEEEEDLLLLLTGSPLGSVDALVRSSYCDDDDDDENDAAAIPHAYAAASYRDEEEEDGGSPVPNLLDECLRLLRRRPRRRRRQEFPHRKKRAQEGLSLHGEGKSREGRQSKRRGGAPLTSFRMSGAQAIFLASLAIFAVLVGREFRDRVNASAAATEETSFFRAELEEWNEIPTPRCSTGTAPPRLAACHFFDVACPVTYSK